MNEPIDTLATLLAWKDMGPGRRVTVCRRCGAPMELRLMDDLLGVACPGCAAQPLFEAVRELELEAGWKRARTALEALGVLAPHESAAALAAAGEPPVARRDDPRSGFVGAVRALGFFRKSLYLSVGDARGGELVLRPLEALIGPEQLAEAVELELAEGTPSGEVIGRLVLAAEKEKLYGEADAVEHVDLDRLEVEPAVVELVPAALAASDLIVPVRLEGERLVVAMLDPLDYEQIDRVKFLVGREVRAVAASEDALLRALERLFPDEALLEGELPQPLLGGEDAGELALLEAMGTEAEPSAETLEAAGMPESRPGERTFERLVRRLVEERARTLLIEPLEITWRARLERGGRLRDVALLEREAGEALCRHIAERAGIAWEPGKEAAHGVIEMQLGGERVELEARLAQASFGSFVAISPIDRAFRSLSLDALTLLPDDAGLLRTLREVEPGWIVVSGARGAGRSTLLYALFREADRAREQVLVFERTTRARVEGVTQLAAADWTVFAPLLEQVQARRVFCDDLFAVPGAATAPAELRMLLDVALCGGHVVLSVPGEDAVAAIARLLGAGLPADLLARTLRALVGVRLVRRLCPRCRKEFEPEQAVRERLGLPEALARLYVGIGCAECGGRGYGGQAALIELLPVAASAAMARAVATLDREALDRAADELGVTRLRTKALRAVRAGLTPVAEVRELL